jgi:hypothetical protein
MPPYLLANQIPWFYIHPFSFCSSKRKNEKFSIVAFFGFTPKKIKNKNKK